MPFMGDSYVVLTTKALKHCTQPRIPGLQFLLLELFPLYFQLIPLHCHCTVYNQSKALNFTVYREKKSVQIEYIVVKGNFRLILSEGVTKSLSKKINGQSYGQQKLTETVNQ